MDNILLEKGSIFTYEGYYNNVYLSEPVLKIQVCGNIQFGNGTQRIQKEAEKVKNKESAFT
jgi:hypothetical protein